MKDYKKEIEYLEKLKGILKEIKEESKRNLEKEKYYLNNEDEYFKDINEDNDSKYDYIQGHKNPFEGKRKKLFYEYVEKYNIQFSENERIAYTEMMQSEYNRQKGHTLKLFHETPAWEIGCDMIGTFVSFLDNLV